MNRAVPSEKYFLRLGDAVSSGLHQAGYAFCSGEVMARNPKWNRPIQDWKHYFRDWIIQANPQDLLEFNTFFDFRCIWGEWELARDLRTVIQSLIAEHPPFLLHLRKMPFCISRRSVSSAKSSLNPEVKAPMPSTLKKPCCPS